MNGWVVGILLIICSQWSTAAESPQTAQQVVDVWLAQLDAEDYAATWQATAPVFKSKITSKRWAKMAKSARAPLGEFHSRKLLGAVYQNKLPGAPAGDYIVFQYESDFKKKDGVIETITPMLVNGIWQISGYYVR